MLRTAPLNRWADLISWKCECGQRAVCSGGLIVEAVVLWLKPGLKERSWSGVIVEKKMRCPEVCSEWRDQLVDDGGGGGRV